MYSTLWLRVLSSGSYGHRHSPDLYGNSGARSSGEQHHTAVSAGWFLPEVRAFVCTCLRSHQYRVPGRDAQYKYPVFAGKNDHQIPTAQKTWTLLEKHPKNRNGCSEKNAYDFNFKEPEKTEKAEWMKLRLYTREGTYKISFKFLTHGKDEFLSMLFKMIQKYGISCMQTDK